MQIRFRASSGPNSRIDLKFTGYRKTGNAIKNISSKFLDHFRFGRGDFRFFRLTSGDPASRVIQECKQKQYIPRKCNPNNENNVKNSIY